MCGFEILCCREQLNAISFNCVKVNSVDGFQGQEKEVNQSLPNQYLWVILIVKDRRQRGKSLLRNWLLSTQVIILSTVRSNKEKDIGFLKEKRRLNVAVSETSYLSKSNSFISIVRCSWHFTSCHLSGYPCQATAGYGGGQADPSEKQCLQGIFWTHWNERRDKVNVKDNSIIIKYLLKKREGQFFLHFLWSNAINLYSQLNIFICLSGFRHSFIHPCTM